MSPAMTRNYRKYDEDFKAGAVELVTQTGKPIAQVARELGINEGTLGNWCAKRRRDGEIGQAGLGESERAELDRLRKEVTELRMQRDVLKRSVALWVDEAMGR
jgi:transposase